MSEYTLSNGQTLCPITIVQDRYTGVYSGGKWTAWNHDPQDIPFGIIGEDTEARNAWIALEEDEITRKLFRFGVGDTIEEAIKALIRDVEERGEAPESLNHDESVPVYDKRLRMDHCTIVTMQRIFIDEALVEERYDKYPDCTAVIWKNSTTGKTSVGWRTLADTDF